METDTRDLLKKRVNEGLEKLADIEDSTERKKKVDEIKILADIDVAYEKNEQERHNDNWKNELDEQKLLLDQKKLKNEKARLGVDIGKTVFFGVLGVSSSIGSYFLGSFLQKDNKLDRFGEKLNDFMMKWK